jgi:hypothetical protein
VPVGGHPGVERRAGRGEQQARGQHRRAPSRVVSAWPRFETATIVTVIAMNATPVSIAE